MQLTHYNTNFNKRRFPIILICEQVTNAPNIGRIFRTADAFGIEAILFSNQCSLEQNIVYIINGPCSQNL